MGLPGSGKTALAQELARQIGAVHWNADAVRKHVNKDLGFSIDDRIEQARRMRWLCDVVLASGNWVVADFVCPLPECREAFGDTYIVYVNRIDKGRFEDTNKLFVPPSKFDVEIREGMTIKQEVDLVIASI